MSKKDLALDNQQWLIDQKTKPILCKFISAFLINMVEYYIL